MEYSVGGVPPKKYGTPLNVMVSPSPLATRAAAELLPTTNALRDSRFLDFYLLRIGARIGDISRLVVGLKTKHFIKR